MDKTMCRALFDCEILTHTSAGIDGEHDIQRHLGLPLEDRDRLRMPILGHDKIILVQAADQGSILICNIDKDIYQANIDADRRDLHLRRRVSLSALLAIPSPA